MSEEKLVAKIAAEYVGRETGLGEPLEIEKGAVRRFAEAIFDGNNPLYRDADFASQTIYGGIPMPPAFLTTNMPSGSERDFDIPLPLTRRVRGGDELIFYRPIKVGDTIRANTRILSIEEKEGRSGKMIFITTETNYYNQHGELCMTNKVTVVKR
ncbi:MAG: hypothetical protein PWP65_80 [Clostridia bacterium]|nr:hypothetical protein [Clostridia bacterium]